METRNVPPTQASSRQTEMGDKFDRALFAALDALQERQIPYALIGGIAASGLGRPRSTHDIDIFVRPEDAEAALDALAIKGFDVERTDARWLFKGWREEMMVDIIFKSQGDIYFDDEMHKRAKLIHYHGRDIPVVSPEDLVIIKGAVHSEVGPHHWHDALAILSHANLDWEYLLRRARRSARRLLALLIYAQSNDIWIPNNVIIRLFQTIFGDTGAQAAQTRASLPEKREPIPAQGVSRPPMPDDAYLIGHILEALATDQRTANLDCQLTLGLGKILVKGEVQTHEQRRSIENLIREKAPDFDVDNQIRLYEMKAPEQVEEVV